MAPRLVLSAGATVISLLVWFSTLIMATPAHATAAPPDAETHVVMLGVPGLTWDDVTQQQMPTLWSMVAAGAPSASLSMFATINSCDADGWLTVATGVPTAVRVDDRCIPTTPVPAGDGATMSHWSDVEDVQSVSAFHPELGRLTADLEAQGVCLSALGSGAAATAADADGFVTHYSTETTAPVPTGSCRATVVDAASDGNPRPSQLDQVIRNVTSALPDDATALIFSVPDQRDPARAMGVAVEYRSGLPPSAPTYLSSATTRWPGVVSLIDISPTVFARLGLAESSAWVGAPWTAVPASSAIASVPEALAVIGDRDNSLRDVTWFFLGSVVLISLIVWGAGEVSSRSRSTASAWVERVTRSTRLATWLLAFPIASFAIGAFPWWHSSRPVVALYAGALLLTVLLGELLRFISRRRGALAAALTATLGLTVLILGDVVAGGSITRGSPLAPSPLSGGRFYGLSNATSASMAVAAVWAGVLVAAILLRRHRRRTVLILFGAFSAAVVLITALPTMGADVGGALTLLPTFAITAAYFFKVRVTLWRISAVVIACVLVPLAIALVDYTRPAEQRTHLGRFVDLAVSGQAWDLISRKAGYASSSLVSLMSLVTLLALAVIAYQVLLLVRHQPLPPSWAAMADNRAVGAAVLGSWIAMVTGSAVNDYGIRMATIGLILLVPLLLLTLRHVGASPDSLDEGHRASALADPEGEAPVPEGEAAPR